MDWANRRVVVTGGTGFLGQSVCARLAERGCREIFSPRRRDYDLVREQDVERMYDDFRPDVVLHLAAEVGGIGAHRENPGRFFYANMAMGLHMVEHARIRGIEKFVQVGTVCSYPKFAQVPFTEEDLWSGYPEETNAPYAMAKKTLFVMLDAYRRKYGLKSSVVVPVNLYGPGDNFDLRTSHVAPALIRKCLEARDSGAKSITCWGTGNATREFLYVDDAADGILIAAEKIDDPFPINLGTGTETPIREFVTSIAEVTGFKGEIRWDADHPDGQARRCVDVTRARTYLGWEARVGLRDGLRRTVDWYVSTPAYRGQSAKAA